MLWRFDLHSPGATTAVQQVWKAQKDAGTPTSPFVFGRDRELWAPTDVAGILLRYFLEKNGVEFDESHQA